MAPVTLETLAGDVALLRDELRCISETLLRLDGACHQLEQRLIAMRDETQDVASEMRGVRRELLAQNRLGHTISGRLDEIERRTATSSAPSAIGGYPTA